MSDIRKVLEDSFDKCSINLFVICIRNSLNQLTFYLFIDFTIVILIS